MTASENNANGSASASASGGSKATSVNIAFDHNLRSSLAHLPPSVHLALVARDIPPQNIVLQLSRVGAAGQDGNGDDDDEEEDSPSSGRPVKDHPRHTVFVGWTGQSSNIDSTVLLSADLSSLWHPKASPSENYTLILLRSPPLPTASRVNLTPLTPDDWELLSQNAGAVEENMLFQVRSVSAGGRACIFVGRGASQRCWLSVDSTDPVTSHCTALAITSPSPSRGRERDRPLPRAVRLTTATEIVIAPRTRQSSAEAAASEEHSIFGTQPMTSSHRVGSVITARNKLKNRLYRVLPLEWRPEVVPEMASRYEWAGQEPIAVISGEAGDPHWDDCEPDWQLLSRAFANSERESWARATVTVLPCPTAQLLRPITHITSTASDLSQSEASRGKSTATKPSQPTAASWLLKGQSHLYSMHLASDTEENRPQPWPRRWVWLNASLREKLGGVGAGETVCFAAPPPSGNPSGPPAASDDSARNAIPFCRPTCNLAGVGSLLTKLEQHVRNVLSSFGIVVGPSAGNLLLHGPSGIGRTRILTTLAAALQHSLTTVLYVDCTPLSEMRISQLKAIFKEWRDALDWYAKVFSGAAFAGGAVLMLDNLDKVLIAEVENVDPTRARTLAECFVQALLAPSSQAGFGPSPGTVILATANSSSSLHKLLAEKHAWSESIGIKPPGKSERAEILADLVSKKVQSEHGFLEQPDRQDGIAAHPSLNYVLLSAHTEGYLPADLVDLVDRAIYRAAIRMNGAADDEMSRGSAKVAIEATLSGVADISAPPSSLVLTSQDFKAAQENFVPLSLRSVSLSSSGSVSWSSVGGLQETRRVLRETLEFPTRYAQIFASCPLRLRSGLLLYGYPGCGKTMLASAVAKECGANFISVKGPEILNKYIGASEKSVRDLFERALAAKPCVLFFDEFDSIAPKRGHDSTGVTDRVVNQLLTQMDGAEGLSGVYVLAATSRPDLIDSALLRPGRLDKSLLCDMPTKEDRVDIFKAIVREGSIKADDGQVRWEEWADKTEGFSGADLQALVYNAHLEVVHESISSAHRVNGAGEGDAREASGEDKVQTLKFVEVKGGQGRNDVRRSGAEEQALRRRLEMALANSKNASRAKKSKAASPLQGTTSLKGSNSSPTGGAASQPRLITSAHLARSLASMRPSVPASERLRLQRIYRDFAGSSHGEASRGGTNKGRGADFPSGEGSREVGARQSLM